MTSNIIRSLLFLIVSIFISFSTNISEAKRISDSEVPDTLKPWAGWVLHGFEEQKCPSPYNNLSSYRCVWPSRLELKIDEAGGHFVQQWQLFRDDWIYLPGSRQHWPQEVRSGKEALKVIERNGRPSIYMMKGDYQVEGVYAWKKMPENLAVPADTGLVDLSVNGKEVPFPNLDEQGRLWLRKSDFARKDAAGEENSLDLKVYRQIVDDIPLTVITHIELDVSGEHREILLGGAMNAGFIPMSISSLLPARLEADGRLRLQVRPGRWSLDLTARHTRPLYEIPFVSSGPDWVDEEVWVFQSMPNLRMVAIEGVTAIDPQQTMLPQQWRHLPAYRIRAGEVVKIVEKKRGDPDPAPDQLTLDRDIWLAFDGEGYTMRDRITGSMRRGWRLEMNPVVQLGRVSIDGRDQFITRMKEGGAEGVEVRKGRISLQADSRLETGKGKLPAVGWNHDFHSVSGRLHLPPGWRLFDVSGVDHISGTLLKRWNLLDLFIVLIISLSFMKLWGRQWGLLALLAMVTFYHEPGSPRFVWLSILAAVALLRVLPVGKARNVTEAYKWLSILLLIMISIPFTVSQIRQGIYPQLEKPWQGVGQMSFGPAGQVAEKRAEAPVSTMEMVGGEVFDEVESADAYRDREISSIKPSRKSRSYYSGQMQNQYDPKASVQTGPGLPEWQWNSVSFRWNGPVEKNQQLGLILMSPMVNSILSFARVLLLALLLLKLIAGEYRENRDVFTKALSSGGKESITVAALICLFLILGAGRAEADIPPKEMLDELRTRLLEKPECAPKCADSQRLSLMASRGQLRIRMDVQSYADLYVPLPGQAMHWLPKSIFVNGKPAQGLLRTPSGHIWTALGPGRHQLVMEGPLPERKSVQLPLLMNPHRVEVKAAGWTVEGVHDDGLTEGQIVLSRIQSQAGSIKKEDTLEPATLPPFVRLERTLRLGLTWQIDTMLVRLSPAGSAVLLEVPLLEGESVTTEKVRVRNGKVMVNLGPRDTSVGWVSSLEKREQIILKSARQSEWTETWRLDLSPVWHVTIGGIPPIHHQDSQGNWLPEWRPWPGEELSIGITRPEGVPGQTLTIDKSQMDVAPGRRASDVKLSASFRSSRGGQHEIVLPEEARLMEVKINGSTQPIRQEGRSVVVPLKPGAQSLELSWRSTGGMGPRFTTPLVDIGTKSVNARVHLKMPGDRWVLFTSGPSMGPAVLFWGILLVIMLIAAGLGHLTITPLKSRHWILLGVGLSQLPVPLALLVVFWLIALGWRARMDKETKKGLFNTVQAALFILTLIALASLFGGISQGLLGRPEMHIAGNQSSSYMLRWYQDMSEAVLPRGTVISVPLTVYRLAMLAWSLWIASALIGWLKWGWECFSANGIWQPVRPRIIRPGRREKLKKDEPGEE